MQRLCIFSKKVHASKRRWSRLVIPGAQVPHFEAMQRELRTSGDFQLWVMGSGGGSGGGGGGGAQDWRWGCRMSVQVKWCCAESGQGCCRAGCRASACPAAAASLCRPPQRAPPAWPSPACQPTSLLTCCRSVP
jgi:hypothetical protein